RNLFEEAMKLDILVKDKKGGPYMVPNTAFDVGMLDLTHPKTADWFKQILQEMVDDGVRGWMADFGEGLPVDACLYSGEDPITAHNRYPEIWAKLNREFVDEWKSSCLGKQKEDPQEALVFYMRAGFRGSPKWASLFWEGDQMVSWQANDGIKSAVVGLLSSGLSGYAFNHSDIGGYCSVSLPFFKYQRSEELLLRWMELNAFTTIFRTHEGNKPSCNSQFYSNQRTLSHFSRFAKIYKAWKFYRIQLVKEASEKGLPVCRHLFLHYPEDEYVHRLTYEQFLVGTEILVVPVLDKGKEVVKVYFPEGERCAWKHIWTGKLHSKQGSESWVEAPIGYPAIFVKDGSKIGETFLENLREYNIL
ncbi:Alpha-glucosidase 2, partial [Sesamum angolense]